MELTVHKFCRPQIKEVYVKQQLCWRVEDIIWSSHIIFISILRRFVLSG